MRRRFVGLFFALSVLGADVASAQRSIVFEALDSDIEVLPDGDLLVTETLRPRFTGSWNGIRRIVSLRPPADYDPDYLLDVRLVSATDAAGRALRHETSRVDRESRQFKVWVPDAEDRSSTVVLTYRVGNALGHFEADSLSGTPPWDELYWQATGTEWDVPILSAAARIRLPDGATTTQAAAYVGEPGSTERAEVRLEDEEGVAVGPVGPLRPGQGLTLAVGWPAGFVARPAPGERAAFSPIDGLSPLAAWPLLLPIFAFGFAYRAWDRRGRDPSELAVTTHWEPPAGLTPAEAGTLVDHHAGIHDIVSTLVDLAVKGYVVIEEGKKEGFLAWGKEYTFHSTRPRSEWLELPEHERLFLQGLFDGPGPSVRLSDLENEFYKSIPKISDALQRALVVKGYYLRRPDHVRRRWLGLAALALAIAFFGGPMLTMVPSTPLTGVALVVGAVLTALILGAFGWFMPARTESGARAREAVLGFKRFLERVEAPRYRRMITSPDVFEAYLPFAMAFGCEERWARAFEGLVQEPPQWYRGSSMTRFQPAAFAKSLGTLTTAAQSTLSSSPSSSGSGGGGSVGGGGGGGGGGGF
ncbi:MAG TPA: DUF2207 domain-containing protein [Longimicrobiales bacterium]|nr:DUF2207 domain-containing protein [Longimicrobiales bacterium]